MGSTVMGGREAGGWVRTEGLNGKLAGSAPPDSNPAKPTGVDVSTRFPQEKYARQICLRGI
jgi:hypothetical protein